MVDREALTEGVADVLYATGYFTPTDVERVAAEVVDAVLALPVVVDDATVERAAQALSDDCERGYRGHWCDEWQQDGGCECCRRAARAALEAALSPQPREGEQR